MAARDPAWVEFGGTYVEERTHMPRQVHGWLRDLDASPDPMPMVAVKGCSMMLTAQGLARVGLLAEEYFLNFDETDWCYRAREAGHGLDLVDVGCAHADFEGFVRPHLRSYTGIEPSKALLPKDRSHGKAFRLKRGTAEKLPLPAASADALLLKEVLDHCYDPSKVLAEAARVLRPGGWVLITLTNDHAWYKRLFRVHPCGHD